MPWWRFWEQDTEPEPSAPMPRPRTATVGKPPPRPPRPQTASAPTGDETRQRLAQLRKRRELVAFDLKRAEAATRPDNPWQERIDLLGESIAAVAADLAALDNLPPAPSFPVPETPITGIAASGGEPASVSFTIGRERFLFEEEPDWDQRGGPRVRGDLQSRTGDVAALVPDDTPSDGREALTRHLIDSVAVFATDLRDRALESEPLPVAPTLADLARPCPECGGWRDWRGTCEVCNQRAWRRQGLTAEMTRFETERTEAAEDRHKWAERLAIARRRLAEVDAEIAKVEGPSNLPR
jgi:hypothetical protein